jgi:hypothetical protein
MAPIVSNVPAIACTKDQCCMCRGIFADVFSQWICPHCKSHLSTSGMCLNFCSLRVTQDRAEREARSMLLETYDKK